MRLGGMPVVVAVMVAMNAVVVDAVVETASSVDLDDMLGTTPVSQMMKSIDAGIRDEVSHAEKAIDQDSEAPVSAVLDDDIERAAELREHHGDIGEGDSAAQGVTARAAVKAQVLKELHAAQVALTNAGGYTHLPVAAAKPVMNVAKAAAAKVVPKPHHADTGGDMFEGEDPIDAMKSIISAQMHQTLLKSSAPNAEDPLDQAIDRIGVVRAREKAKRLATPKKAKKAERDESASVLSLLQESEEVVPGAGITGDTGQTIPPSNNAPDTGQKNPPVKENTPMLPDKVPLGRTTPPAPSDGAALDQVLATQKGAPSSTGPSTAAPPPPDSKFSKNEINHEIKAIGSYPIAKDEAINEAVKQLVPWDKRPDAPTGPKAKGPAIPTVTPPAVQNSTNATTV